MSDMIVTDEQVQILGQSQGVVLLRNTSGMILGRAEALDLEEQFTSTFTEAEVAEAERRAKSSKTWHTTAELLHRMQDASE